MTAKRTLKGLLLEMKLSEDRENRILAEEEIVIMFEKLIDAGEGLFLRMDYFMGDTDPLDDQDENVLACQKWREVYSQNVK